MAAGVTDDLKGDLSAVDSCVKLPWLNWAVKAAVVVLTWPKAVAHDADNADAAIEAAQNCLERINLCRTLDCSRHCHGRRGV